jgi:hypothetical protein
MITRISSFFSITLTRSQSTMSWNLTSKFNLCNKNKKEKSCENYIQEKKERRKTIHINLSFLFLLLIYNPILVQNVQNIVTDVILKLPNFCKNFYHNLHNFFKLVYHGIIWGLVPLGPAWFVVLGNKTSVKSGSIIIPAISTWLVVIFSIVFFSRLFSC